jgi:hypothetical protein
VQLKAVTGDITQDTDAADAILAAGLGAWAGGNVVLDTVDTDGNPINTVDTFAAKAGGDVKYNNKGDLGIGEVDEVGSISALEGVDATAGDAVIDATEKLWFELTDAIIAGHDIKIQTATTSGNNIDTEQAAIFRMPVIEEPGKTVKPGTGDLTLDAGHDVIIGHNRDGSPASPFDPPLALSVPGDLTIIAGNDAKFGDVAALTLKVTAGGVIQPRRRAAILEYDDGGVNLVANSFDLNKDIDRTGGSEGKIIIGTPNGGPVPPVVDDATVVFRPIFEGDGSRPLTAEDFPIFDAVSGEFLNVVRWFPAGGPVPPCVGCANQPQILEELTWGIGVMSQLNQAAVSAKPLWGSEVTSYLACSIFEEEDPDLIPPECEQYAAEDLDPRLETETIQGAKVSYRALVREEEKVIDSLQRGADAYRAAVPAREVSGKGFRAFLAADADSLEALGYLNRLTDLSGKLGLVATQGVKDASASELRDFFDLLVDDVTPNGLSPEELKSAIDAGGDLTLEQAGKLFASDGLPTSARTAVR